MFTAGGGAGGGEIWSGENKTGVRRGHGLGKWRQRRPTFDNPGGFGLEETQHIYTEKLPKCQIYGSQWESFFFVACGGGEKVFCFLSSLFMELFSRFKRFWVKA